MDFLEKIKNVLYDYKSQVILGVVLLGIILFSNFTIYFLLENKIEDKRSVVIEPVLEEEKEEVVEKILYKVDIKGAVKKPGVYQLEKDKRVVDVITMAGGLAENADTRVNNLSKYVQDEMVIVIYTKEEVDKFHEVKEKELLQNKECKVYNEEVRNDSCIESDSEEENGSTMNDVDVKVSINTASLELLMTLPGIGEAKAKTIIEYRNKQKFEKIEDLMNVSGIGEKAFEKIKEYITI